MMWRTSDQIVAQRGYAYALIDPSGEVSSWFSPRTVIDADDLRLTTYRVIGGDLVETTTVERGPVERSHEELVVVRGLSAVSDEETRRAVDAALAADDRARQPSSAPST